MRGGVGFLIQVIPRKRRRPAGPSLQRQRPTQHDPLRVCKARHLQLLEQGNIARILSDEAPEVRARPQGVPAFGTRPVRCVREVAGFQAGAVSLPRVRQTGFKRSPPEVHVGMKLLMNLGSKFGVTQTLIQG